MKLKRMLAMLLVLVLVAGLGIGILGTDAYADKEKINCTKSYNLTVGYYCERTICSSKYGRFDTFELTWNGLTLKGSDYDVTLSGTPKSAGSHTFTKTIDDEYTADWVLNITVNVTEKKKETVTQTLNTTVGSYNSYTYYSHKYGQLDHFTLTWNGLTLTGDSLEVTLTGTPTGTGSHTFSKTIDDGDTADVTINITVNVTEAPKVFSITKSPTKETKTEGESALFIAAAENYSSVEWIVKNKSGSETYIGKSAIEKAFSGISVSLYQDKSGRECMNLKKLPMSINGYYVQAKFTNTGKTESKTTEAALLTVKEAAPDAPTIAGQSGDANLKPGEKVTLSVTAKSAEGTTLQYQWHCQKDSTDAADEVISGATASSYTPEERTGNTYYYCVVSAAKGGKTSGETVSEKIEVHYEEPVAEPEPEPAPEPEPEPEPEPAPEPTPAPTEVEKDNTGKKPVKETETEPAADPEPAEKATEKSDHTIAFLIAGVVIVAMICGTVLYVVNKRKD